MTKKPTAFGSFVGGMSTRPQCAYICPQNINPIFLKSEFLFLISAKISLYFLLKCDKI